MERKEIWSSLDESIIEKYSTLFNIYGIQIAIIILIGILFATVILIYLIIWCFDKSVKPSLPTQYSIRFDPKGFSCNELRLYNVKSVDGGCRLRSIKSTQRGKAGILQAEKMFDLPFMPRMDILIQPWICETPITAQTAFQIVEWNDFFDSPAENSDVPSSVTPKPAPAPTPASGSKKEEVANQMVVQKDKKS